MSVDPHAFPPSLQPLRTLPRSRAVVAAAGLSAVLVMSACAPSAEPDASPTPLVDAVESPAPEPSVDPVDAEAAALVACMEGDWQIDGPQLWRNISASTGIAADHLSGTYGIRFNADGTTSTLVSDFAVVFRDSEEGDFKLYDSGNATGVWQASTVTPEEADILAGVDRSGSHHLPYVYFEDIDVDFTNRVMVGPDGEVIPPIFGSDLESPGMAGEGPVDCAAGTFLLRSFDPEQPWDIPIVRR